jgi:hypothetical protein
VLLRIEGGFARQVENMHGCPSLAAVLSAILAAIGGPTLVAAPPERDTVGYLIDGRKLQPNCAAVARRPSEIREIYARREHCNKM